MREDSSRDYGATSSPGRALLYGLGAGLGVLFLGVWEARALDAEGSLWGAQLLWTLPLLCAAVAAGVAAATMGSSGGRLIALALFAFFGAFFVSGVMDYDLMWSAMSAWSEPGKSYWTGEEVQRVSDLLLWRRHLLVSACAITGGTLLGMLFGRRGVLQ
ncbi:MAG: hypothetical protein ACE5MG_01640 [Candidatus Methylomirabilales bacterium]